MLKDEVQFYRELIEDNFWPYWQQHIDTKFGGVYTCISNDGLEVLSKDKYTWSQGRFLWLCASLYECVESNLLQINQEQLIQAAYQTATFLQEHAIMDNQQIAFLLTRDGRIVEQSKNDSIFADCFFILGFSKFSKTFNELEAYKIAKNIYQSVVERINAGNFNTEPYPIPDGFESQSISMILMNVTQELAEAEKHFEGKINYAFESREYSKDLFTRFLTSEGKVTEFLTDIEELKNSILATHINPGHTIEAIWFHLHLYEMLDSLTPSIISNCEKMFVFNYENGWDPEFGGLKRFVYDKDIEPSFPLEHLIVETDKMKLWWPHSEALYTSLLLYELTNKESYYKYYSQVKAYIFDHFPNHDTGEWYQILDQKGQPQNKVVALPVKDPFHILRNFICIVRRWG